MTSGIKELSARATSGAPDAVMKLEDGTVTAWKLRLGGSARQMIFEIIFDYEGEGSVEGQTQPNSLWYAAFRFPKPEYISPLIDCLSWAPPLSIDSYRTGKHTVSYWAYK